MRAWAVLLLLLPLGCGDAARGPSTTAAPPAAVARFAPSATVPWDWGEVPFPSDLYRDSSGAIRLGALPSAADGSPLLEALLEVFRGRDGFCATCNVYFRIDGPIDGSALTEALGSGEASPSDPVVLADVDPASPERGRLFPLQVQWDPERGVLALRPERGIALHRSRRYAAALTDGVRASDGSSLAASGDFLDVRDGSPADADDRIAAVVEPALAELERIGIARRSVVAVAAFTTEDVTAHVVDVRAAVREGPAIDVVVERVRRGPEIDELLGLPSEDRPGIDVPPIPGTPGTRSIVHGTLAEVVTGSLLAPRLVRGSGTDIGTLRRDDSGRIVPGPREVVPFVLTIPRGVDRSSVPIAIAHHGFNASRTTGFATAETAARAGVAILAIDAFQHGDRAVSARDERHALRGDVEGPDGFAETDPADVSGRIFGIFGAEPGLEGFPGYSLASLLQFVADVASTVRAVQEGAFDGASNDGAAEEPIVFDSGRIGFVGNSLGAVVGAGVLVAEPDLRAAVQNVPPGSIVETLAESPEFRPLVEALFLPGLGVEGPFDEVERRLLFDPIVDLSRWVLEPADPLALAPYLLLDRVDAGSAPAILFQVASLDEVASSLATASMLEASGSERISIYDPAAHGMLEVLAQSSRFEPPAAPPYRPRADELPIENPLEAEHREIREFLDSELAGTP